MTQSTLTTYLHPLAGVSSPSLSRSDLTRARYILPQQDSICRAVSHIRTFNLGGYRFGRCWRLFAPFSSKLGLGRFTRDDNYHEFPSESSHAISATLIRNRYCHRFLPTFLVKTLFRHCTSRALPLDVRQELLALPATFVTLVCCRLV
eukprot:1797686-Pleurochrysis_carterae.AAC.1